jgi:hypothetical protein
VAGLNKKGLIVDEISNGVKLLLALSVLGIVVVLVLSAFGMSPLDYITNGISALTGASSSNNITLGLG